MENNSKDEVVRDTEPQRKQRRNLVKNKGLDLREIRFNNHGYEKWDEAWVHETKRSTFVQRNDVKLQEWYAIVIKRKGGRGSKEGHDRMRSLQKENLKLRKVMSV